MSVIRTLSDTEMLVLNLVNNIVCYTLHSREFRCRQNCVKYVQIFVMLTKYLK